MSAQPALGDFVEPAAWRLIAPVLWLSLAALSSAQEPPSDHSPLRLRDQIDAAFADRWGSGDWPLADDGEFVRRVYLDLWGRIPSASETREFLADAAPQKREALIERLLEDPRYARQMAIWFDVTTMERRAATHVPHEEWMRYLSDSFAADKPLDQLLREMLASDGSPDQNRIASKFLLEREVDPHLLTRDVGRIVFGMDLQCAQCHDHPNIDSYHQDDYYGLYAAWQRSSPFKDAEGKLLVAEKGEGEFEFVSVFTGDKGQARVRLPDGWPLDELATAQDDRYVVPPSDGVRPIPRASRRMMIAGNLMTTPDRSFARNWGNRLWATLFGRGLVHPLDLHHDDNPSTHPQLMEVLAEALIEHHGSTRFMMRELACSRAYQRTFDVERVLLADSIDLPFSESTLTETKTRLESARDAELRASSARDLARRTWDATADQRRESLSARLGLERTLATESTEIASLQQRIDQLSQQLGEARQAVEHLTRATELLGLPSEGNPSTILSERVSTWQTELEQAQIQQRMHQESQQVAAAGLQSAMTAVSESESKHQESELHWQTAWTHWRSSRAERVLLEEQVNCWEGRLERRQALLDLREIESLIAMIRQQMQTLSQAVGKEGEDPEAVLREHLQSDQLDEVMHWYQAVTAVKRAASASDQQIVAQIEERYREVLQRGFTLAQEALDQKLLDATRQAQEARTRWLAIAESQGLVSGLTALTPEQLAWSLMQATGVFDAQIETCEAELIAGNSPETADAASRRVAATLLAMDRLAGSVQSFVTLFGHGAGQSQDAFFATADQSLFLGNAGVLQNWIGASGNSLKQRVLLAPTSDDAVNEITLTLFSRTATDAERGLWRELHSAETIDRAAMVDEWIWAGLTSVEFRFNR